MAAALPELSLAEWVVLAVVDERPAHGFVIAAQTAPTGTLGRVWHIPRPVVYRSLPRLEEAGLVTAEAALPGQGPARYPYRVSRSGHRAVDRWLQTPAAHVRDVRSELLLKLALLDRRGRDRADLVALQLARLEPIAAGLLGEPVPDGFDGVLAAWRRANVTATLAFLSELG